MRPCGLRWQQKIRRHPCGKRTGPGKEPSVHCSSLSSSTARLGTQSVVNPEGIDHQSTRSPERCCEADWECPEGTGLFTLSTSHMEAGWSVVATDRKTACVAWKQHCVGSCHSQAGFAALVGLPRADTGDWQGDRGQRAGARLRVLQALLWQALRYACRCELAWGKLNSCSGVELCTSLT